VASAAETPAPKKRLGPLGEDAAFKVLIEGSDLPLNEWIAAASVALVLLPARRRVLRAATHPAAARLRQSTDAAIRVVHPKAQREAQPGEPRPTDLRRASA
jgi:hypothetical protein